MKRGLASYITTTIAFAFMVHIQAKSQQPSGDAAWQQYQHILHASTLEWPSEPFLLKVDYQLYDLDGRPIETGTAEESWTETNGEQMRIQSPSLAIADAPPADEYTIHTRENYLVHQAINAFIRPIPSSTEQKDFAMEEFHQTLAHSELSCFSLDQPGKTQTRESHTYCTDEANRMTTMTGPLFVIERSDFRQVRGHQIPSNLILSYEGKPALSMQVTELDPLPEVSDPNNNLKRSPPNRVFIDSDAMLSLNKSEPKYPVLAKVAHISGSVVLTAIVTKQGTLEGLDVIASPSLTLTKSARNAVQKWTYQPFLNNGVPSEVETTIIVNYKFDSK
jgi:TonB family protein